MYTLTVRDYLRCAHSFQGAIFGMGQLLHFMTYQVELVFTTEKLDENSIVVDFGVTQDALQEMLRALNGKNLDELPEFKGIQTTTEFLCHYFHTHVAKAVAPKFHGTLRVILRESPLAEAAYEAPVGR
jgi:6-pyruvoyl-tetrahydropterin synthase